jgi:uncharacterized protein
MSENRPYFRALERAEIDDILGRNQVGRLAYARDGRVELLPIHYVFDDNWIYGRTSDGTKLEMIGPYWWPVAFEVDEVEDVFQWRSVVVHGGFYPIPRSGATWERETWLRALHLVRRVVPEALRDDDPTPERNVLFRIAVQEVTGREAVPWANSGTEEVEVA